jgi:BCD family chlorophyll transporter-like MFS transporter
MILRHFHQAIERQLRGMSPRWLPFADAASADLPLSRLLRLSLFQVSVGMAVALVTGTLNRVMIVELGVASWLVALMVSLPLLFAPFRALLGFKSDAHRSAVGWRRVPYLWWGTLLQFGGLAIMPFALILLSGDITAGPPWIGHLGAAVAFLLVGAGLHTTQTAGLALACDIAPEPARPRVVALLYVMLLLGMVVSSLVFSLLLANFRPVRLIEVVQGAALLTIFLNLIALWKQEPRRPAATRGGAARASFGATWRAFAAAGRARRLLVAVGLGSAAFSMQDILLEPYGGQILGLSVGATSSLTAVAAAGALCAFGLAARLLTRGMDPHRLAGYGALAGVAAFAAVVFSSPLALTWLFFAGSALIGCGGGLFAVGTLTAAMALKGEGASGLALGAWGAVQASSTGLAIAAGGALKDLVAGLAVTGQLGDALSSAAIGYLFVYHLEIALLFATLIALGPLVRNRAAAPPAGARFGLAQFPN